jgi:tetratricopeptide (TPR) repeat protein
MKMFNRILILFSTVAASLASTPEAELSSKLKTAHKLIVDARYTDAVQELTAAIPTANSVDTRPQMRGVLFSLLGIAYQGSGLTSQAEYSFRRSIPLLESSPPTETLVKSVVILSSIYLASGRHKEVEKLPIASLTAALEAERRESVGLAGLLETSALLHAAAGRLDQAEPLFRRSLDLWKRTAGPQHLDTATCLNVFGVAFALNGKFAEGASRLEQAIAILDQIDRDSERTLGAVLSLADAYLAMEQHKSANRLYKRALETIDTRFGSAHPFLLKTLVNYAETLKQLNNNTEAKRVKSRAKRLRAETGKHGMHAPTVHVSELKQC